MTKKFCPVDDEEKVARILFSPSMVDGDLVSWGAFQLVSKLPTGSPEEYLSVWRLSCKVPTPENIKFGSRKTGDELFGYAILSVETIHNLSISDIYARVLSTSKKKSSYHVGIYYYMKEEPIVGECDEPEFILFATTLAKTSTLVIFPKLSA